MLGIRNGAKPRPENYSRIYWDFLAAGEKPPAGNRAIPLRQMMRDFGFTEAEFARLDEAQRNSDALVWTETIAMNAVKGLFDDAFDDSSHKPAFAHVPRAIEGYEYQQASDACHDLIAKLKE